MAKSDGRVPEDDGFGRVAVAAGGGGGGGMLDSGAVSGMGNAGLARRRPRLAKLARWSHRGAIVPGWKSPGAVQ